MPESRYCEEVAHVIAVGAVLGEEMDGEVEVDVLRFWVRLNRRCPEAVPNSRPASLTAVPTTTLYHSRTPTIPWGRASGTPTRTLSLTNFLTFSTDPVS